MRRACSLVVVCERTGFGPSVLMVQRGSKAAFMPDVYVFPGGVVEPTDVSLEQTALRETFEETGLLLTASRNSNDTFLGDIYTGTDISHLRRVVYESPSAFAKVYKDTCVSSPPLQAFARWVTPLGLKRRFDTSFFLINVSESAMKRSENVIEVDAEGEVSHVRWKNVRELLREQSAGLFMVEVPQLYILEQLAESSVERELRAIHPQIAGRDDEGNVVIVFPGDDAYSCSLKGCESLPGLHEELSSRYGGVHRAIKSSSVPFIRTVKGKSSSGVKHSRL